MHVLIIGAGLGGLCLAQGLRKAGIKATVFERDPTPQHRGQGHRVHIDDRGEHALRSCLPDELFNLYRATRGQPETMKLFSAAGEHLTELPPPLTPDGGTMIRDGWSVSRFTLREIMLRGGDIRFGRRFTHYAEEGGQVVAHFADGTTATGDLLVGADGIGSAVRKQKLPHAQVIDTGVRWIAGKTPVTPELKATLPPSLVSGIAGVTGMDPAMIIGYMLFDRQPVSLGLKEPGDYLLWAILTSKERVDDSAHFLPGHRLHAMALDLARTVHPDLRAAVEQAWPEQCFHLTMGTAVPVDPWETTRVTLLGDAVHAMPPARGSGANTALADAAALAAALAEGTPLAEYEDDLRERGFAMVRASADAMEQAKAYLPG
ncbi:FAD-dependent oxidoreductase [Nonomuraea typhae]|uniref:FAD-dependent oxidoreductase n=1 Tax=Nonomuraea typhae TaxID=2603600 RepID=A0ABW7Z9S9_9ACTN